MTMKHFFVFLALLFAVFTSPLAADFSVIRQYVYPIVVTTDGSQTIVSSGSGIVIRDGYMLTVAHVVQKRDQTIFVNDAGLKQARVVKVDPINDLALLAVDVKCPCAQISASKRIEIDSVAYAVGFPLFLNFRLQVLTVGHVQGIRNGDLITTTVTAPGGSGGAIFTKEKTGYRLIGIIKGVAVIDIGPPIMPVEQLQGWFVVSTRSTAIQTFLQSTNVRLE